MAQVHSVLSDVNEDSVCIWKQAFHHIKPLETGPVFSLQHFDEGCGPRPTKQPNTQQFVQVAAVASEALCSLKLDHRPGSALFPLNLARTHKQASKPAEIMRRDSSILAAVDTNRSMQMAPCPAISIMLQLSMPRKQTMLQQDQPRRWEPCLKKIRTITATPFGYHAANISCTHVLGRDCAAAKAPEHHTCWWPRWREWFAYMYSACCTQQ